MLSLLKRLGDPKDTKAARILAVLLLLWEALFTYLIILKVPCTLFIKIFLLSPSTPDTEIDWIAYMEQVEGFQKVYRLTLSLVLMIVFRVKEITFSSRDRQDHVSIQLDTSISSLS